jgi:hypothetical protein
MESNDEDTLWSVGETPKKRCRVEFDHLYERLETQQVGPLSIQNYSEFVEENDCTGNEQSMLYYWNDQTTISNAKGAFPTLEAVGTYLHCLANYYSRLGGNRYRLKSYRFMRIAIWPARHAGISMSLEQPCTATFGGRDLIN